MFLLLLFLSFVGFTLAWNSSEVIDIGILVEKYQCKHDLTTSSTYYSWDIGDGSIIQQSVGVLYSFSVENFDEIRISTCFPQTNFVASIHVFQSYTTVLSDYVQPIDNSNDKYQESLSRISIEVEANQTYYALITPTTEVIGLYSLQIEIMEEDENCSSDFPKQITYPTIIDEYFNTECTWKNGRWYEFIATTTTVTMETCNFYTDVSTTITLYNINGTLLESNSYGCKEFASLRYSQLVINDVYIFSVTSQPPQLLNEQYFQLHVYAIPESSVCENALGIQQLPFSVTYDITNFKTTTITTDSGTQTGPAIYFSISGKNKTIHFSTCSTSQRQSTHTHVSIASDCSGVFTTTGLCGNNSFVDELILLNETYVLRVVCTTPPCILTFTATEQPPINYTQCLTSTVVDFSTRISFSQVVDARTLPTSTNGCSDINNSLQGSWYHLITSSYLSIGVTPSTTNAIGYIEVHNTCDLSCIKTSFSTLFITSNSFIFVTSFVSSVDEKNTFSLFEFWAVTSQLNGDSASRAYVINKIPFTGVASVISDTIAPCRGIRKTGFWLKFKAEAYVMYTTRTGGLESTVASSLDVAADIDGIESLNCVNYSVGTYESGEVAQFTLSKQVDTYVPFFTSEVGIVRYAVYIDEPPINNKCTSAFVIEQSTTIQSYTEKGFSSYSESSEKMTHGVWYRIVMRKPGIISIKISAETSFRSKIEVYEGCDVEGDISMGINTLYTSDCVTEPIGETGTQLHWEMSSNDFIATDFYVFIGGLDFSDMGIFMGNIDLLIEGDSQSNDSSSEDNFLINSTFYEVVEIIWSIIWVITVVWFGVGVMWLLLKNKKIWFTLLQYQQPESSVMDI